MHRAPTWRPQGSESLYNYNDTCLGSPRYNNDTCTLPPPDEVHAHPEPLCDDDDTATVPSHHHDHVATGPLHNDNYAHPEPLCGNDHTGTFLPPLHSPANYANTQGHHDHAGPDPLRDDDHAHTVSRVMMMGTQPL